MENTYERKQRVLKILEESTTLEEVLDGVNQLIILANDIKEHYDFGVVCTGGKWFPKAWGDLPLNVQRELTDLGISLMKLKSILKKDSMEQKMWKSNVEFRKSLDLV